MSAHAYTEDLLIEQPAVEFFGKMEWETVSALHEIFGPSGTLQRETSAEVVLPTRLRTALTKLNPQLPPEAITAAVDQLSRDRSAMLPAAANREVYMLLKDGVQVSVPDRERGGQKIERVRVIDWNDAKANDFLLVSQMTITGPLYTCRPDLIGFVNGLPLVLIEFKKPGVSARAAFDENITSYKHPLNGIPALFWDNALIIASNGTDSRVGSITADWERMSEWKRIEREDEPRRVSLEVMLRGVCEPTRLLDMVENFTLFSEHKSGLIKILAQNHQVLGVNNSIASMLEARKAGHGRAGVFWQTQGSGKSFSMVFFSQKVLRKIAGNWTFVVVIDIIPHRQRMNAEPLDEKFKDPHDPLRLAFVCAMWLTGFDAPSCSTIYLDKPMRNHTLMQTIARANRVFPGKHSGLIADYANVFASLEKALAIYGAGKGGATPVRDKAELIEELRKAVAAAVAYCAEHRVDIAAIENATGLTRVQFIGNAVEALISPDPLRKEFLAHERLVRVLCQAVKPDPAVLEFVSRISCLAVIADEIRLRTGSGNDVDISGVLAKVNELLDESIAADGFQIRADGAGRPLIDLAEIDFEALAKRFKQSKKKNIDLEQLKAAIRAQLDKLIRINKTRADYLAKFEELIESYNSGSRSIEELFEELLAFSRGLNEEQQRHVREHLSDDELTVFDILTRPGPDLSTDEREEVKKAARQLLQRIKGALVLDWRQKAQARAQIRLAIEDSLDDGLPRAYSPELYQQKCSAVFEHIFESYAQGDERVA